MTKRQMRLGLSMRYLGYHDAAWRHPEVPAGGSSDYHHFLRCARRAEEGWFDMESVQTGGELTRDPASFSWTVHATRAVRSSA